MYESLLLLFGKCRYNRKNKNKEKGGNNENRIPQITFDAGLIFYAASPSTRIELSEYKPVQYPRKKISNCKCIYVLTLHKIMKSAKTLRAYNTTPFHCILMTVINFQSN